MPKLLDVTNARPKRHSPGRLLTGHKEVDKVLKNLDVKTANRIARNALGRGTRVFAKHIKKFVPAGQKRMRQAIGWKVGSGKGRGRNNGVTVAKAGAAVSKKDASRKGGIVVESYGEFRSPGTGIGIGARNIHWWLLGTGPRWTKKGQYRGLMPKAKVQFVRLGVASGNSEAHSAIREGTQAQLNKELKKAAK